MSDDSKKQTPGLRPGTVILTDPEEMRQARLSQPIVSTEAKRAQRLRMLEADRGSSDIVKNLKLSEDGEKQADAS